MTRRDSSLAQLSSVVLAALAFAACDTGSSNGSGKDPQDPNALSGSDSGANSGGDGDEGTAGDGDLGGLSDAGEHVADGDGSGACGTRGGKTCAKDEYCDFPRSAQCGANDQGGVCKPKGPGFCTLDYAPVCGCDNETYSNACAAAAAGVSVKAEGECQGGGNTKKTCGGFAGLSCAEGQFCNYEEAAGGQGCEIADGTGVCEQIPDGCTKEYKPVCGCDGETYSNACMAHEKGVSVAEGGACAK